MKEEGFNKALKQHKNLQTPIGNFNLLKLQVMQLVYKM